MDAAEFSETSSLLLKLEDIQNSCQITCLIDQFCRILAHFQPDGLPHDLPYFSSKGKERTGLQEAGRLARRMENSRYGNLKTGECNASYFGTLHL